MIYIKICINVDISQICILQQNIIKYRSCNCLVVINWITIDSIDKSLFSQNCSHSDPVREPRYFTAKWHSNRWPTPTESRARCNKTTTTTTTTMTTTMTNSLGQERETEREEHSLSCMYRLHVSRNKKFKCSVAVQRGPSKLRCETGRVANRHDPYVGFMNFICSDKTTLYIRAAHAGNSVGFL